MLEPPLLFSLPTGPPRIPDGSTRLDGIELSEVGGGTFSRVYLDTPDWRIYKRGGVLEGDLRHEGFRLRWREQNSGHVRGLQRVDSLPRYAHDIENDEFREALEPITKGRVLQPMARVDVEVRNVYVTDAGSGQRLRVAIETSRAEFSLDERGAWACARLERMSSYDALPDRLTRTAIEALSLEPLVVDPLVNAVQEQGLSPRGPQRVPKVRRTERSLPPALARVLLALMDLMEAQEAGLFEDLDLEFLHDFRIAARRARGLLAQLPDDLKGSRWRALVEDFRWLSRRTGRLRDLDVILKDFDTLRPRSPEAHRPHLEELAKMLRRARHDELERLQAALRSRRYAQFKRRYRSMLQDMLRRRPRGKLRKGVRKSVRRCYKSVLARSRRLQDRLNLESLHELRKRCKTLRYLLDAYRPMFSAAETQTALKTLKQLQDCLGKINDLHVQQVLIESAIQDKPLSPSARAAGEDLLKSLQKEQQTRLRELTPALSRFASPANRRQFEQFFATCGT